MFHVFAVQCSSSDVFSYFNVYLQLASFFQHKRIIYEILSEMPGIAHRIFLIKLKKMFDFFKSILKELNFRRKKFRICFSLYYPRDTPRFQKKFSPFGPAVRPSVADKYIYGYKYIRALLYRLYYYMLKGHIYSLF